MGVLGGVVGCRMGWLGGGKRWKMGSEKRIGSSMDVFWETSSGIT